MKVNLVLLNHPEASPGCIQIKNAIREKQCFSVGSVGSFNNDVLIYKENSLFSEPTLNQQRAVLNQQTGILNQH
ncbi:hypothetical protein PQM29_003049 [Morganella morganii]